MQKISKEKIISKIIKKSNLSLAVIGAIFIADEHYKDMSEARLLLGMNKDGADTENEEKLITFKNSHNEGAMLNFGSSFPAITKAVSILFAVAVSIIYVLTLGTKGRYLLKAGLVALLGGAYSNTYDRIKRGYVVDYISINIGNKFMKNVVYNLGDFAIMIGALLVVIGSN